MTKQNYKTVILANQAGIILIPRSKQKLSKPKPPQKTLPVSKPTPPFLTFLIGLFCVLALRVSGIFIIVIATIVCLAHSDIGFEGVYNG